MSLNSWRTFAVAEVVSPRNGFFFNVFPPITVEAYSSRLSFSSPAVSPHLQSLWRDLMRGCGWFGSAVCVISRLLSPILFRGCCAWRSRVSDCLHVKRGGELCNVGFWQTGRRRRSVLARLHLFWRRRHHCHKHCSCHRRWVRCYYCE
jgi:hypothetical protein